jgi:hypothetical protein
MYFFWKERMPAYKNKEYLINWRREHKEYIKNYSKQYRENHKEAIMKYRESHKNQNKIRAEKNRDELSGFHKNYYKLHKKEILKRTKSYYYKNKDKCKLRSRKHRLKRNYNLTLNQYEKLAKKQNNKCAICGINQNQFKYFLNVDHNHQTKKVRGLLCNPCNQSLGGFKESIEILNKAISYLKDEKK